jgi:hypothetical protein
MAHKYYVMLGNLTITPNTMLVPVKAYGKPYPTEPISSILAFCSGMPQFFGGTYKGSSGIVPFLQKKVSEESRNTLELMNTFTPTDILEGTDKNGDDYKYYWANKTYWQPTPTKWGSASTTEEAEMDRIVEVDLSKFVGLDRYHSIQQLYEQTVSEKGPGSKEFVGSLTCEAFLKLIFLYQQGKLL